MITLMPPFGAQKDERPAYYKRIIEKCNEELLKQDLTTDEVCAILEIQTYIRRSAVKWDAEHKTTYPARP